MKEQKKRTKTFLTIDMNKTALNNNKKFVLTDALYITAIIGFTAVCYELFYRMCTRFNGKYKSDFSWYISLPTSDYKEKHRMIGWMLDLLYRHGVGIKGMVLYLALVISFLILANYVYLKFFCKGTNVKRFVLQALSGMMLFMGPIFIPKFHEYFYRWSFQTFAWHSPTEQAMILFSVLAVICFVKMYENSVSGVDYKWWIATAVMVFLSAFSKPAFAIDLMFATVALFLIDLFNPKEGEFKSKFFKLFIMGCSLIPTALYMLVVVKYNFNGSDDLQRATVNFTIKHVLEYPNIFAAIICGLAFPIVVWVTNFRLLKEKRYKTVFAIFIMGVAQWTFFREGGVRERHGNFAWGRQVGCYLLFLTSLAMAVNNWKDDDFMKGKPILRKAYFAVLICLFAMHLVCQLYYFYMICRGHSYLC